MWNFFAEGWPPAKSSSAVSYRWLLFFAEDSKNVSGKGFAEGPMKKPQTKKPLSAGLGTYGLCRRPRQKAAGKAFAGGFGPPATPISPLVDRLFLATTWTANRFLAARTCVTIGNGQDRLVLDWQMVGVKYRYCLNHEVKILVFTSSTARSVCTS